MNNYSMFLPSYTIGQDAYKSVPKICSKYGQTILLVGGKNALLAGEKLLRDSIANSSLKICDVQLFGEDCTYFYIDKLAKIAKDLNVDMIFGMGGGKALDTAKGAANKLGIPVFTFPTIASTCAATTALSVVYNDDKTFKEFYFFDSPAAHCFINTKIIADAPLKFLRAGMGDTIGKYFEAHFASRNDNLEHSSALGVEISNMCYKPLVSYGAKALEAASKHLADFSLEQAVLAILVTTGLVSIFVLDQYNCAVAHSVYYGLVLLPGFDERNLHGDVVAYGVLVQLAVDNNLEELKSVKKLLIDLNIPTTLKEMGVTISRDGFKDVLKEIVTGPDMDYIPYPIDEDMIYNAMCVVENI